MTDVTPPYKYYETRRIREASYTSQLGRATAFMAAIAEIRTLCEPFGDDELEAKLGWCEGRLMERIIIARQQLDKLATQG